MKKLYLWKPNHGWVAYEYENLIDLKSAFEEHKVKVLGYNSRIGENSRIGYNSRIGENSRIGYNSRIGDNSTIGENSTIGYNSTIGENSTIGYNSRIGDNSTIGYNSRIGDNSRIGENSTIGYNSRIGENSRIGYNSRIGDNSMIRTLYITGSRWPVSYYGYDHILIGCKKLTIKQWLKEGKKIGLAEGYTKEELAEYKGYIEMIQDLHKAGTMLPIPLDPIPEKK